MEGSPACLKAWLSNLCASSISKSVANWIPSVILMVQTMEKYPNFSPIWLYLNCSKFDDDISLDPKKIKIKIRLIIKSYLRKNSLRELPMSSNNTSSPLQVRRR